MSANEAKNVFGLMVDTVRAEPVRIEKHGRRVVVIVSGEEHEGFPCNLDARIKAKRGPRGVSGSG